MSTLKVDTINTSDGTGNITFSRPTVLQAGDIVEADIADNAVTLAKMAGGTDGQIITYDASGDPVAVGPGTDGQVLTSTGAGSPPAFEAAGGVDGITTSANATAITISADEEVTMPKQPGFLAHITAAQNNVTGGGQTINVATFTEIFDTNADFNASTGVFTAPVTGIYMFVMLFRVTGITSGMAMDFGLFTSNAHFNHLIWTGSAGPDAQVTTAIADMDASDTANMRITCSAGAQVADIIGGAGSTSFSGFLLG